MEDFKQKDLKEMDRQQRTSVYEKNEKIKYFVQKGKDPDGFEVKFINERKGRGVFSKKRFQTGDFLFQYKGIIRDEEPTNLEYVVEFKHDGKTFWMDANKEDQSIGRLTNDNHIDPNARLVKKRVDNNPCMVFLAQREIEIGEEITFNYDGEKKPTFDWRKSKEIMESSEEEIHSSGTEWQPSDESEEENDDSCQKRRINEWVKEATTRAKETLRGRSKQKISTNERSRKKSVSRPRPTKRLPSKQEKQIEKQPSETLEPKPKSKNQCHVCGKSIKNLNRHLKEVHQIGEPKADYVISNTKGYVVRYCPLCGKVEQRLNDHLKRTHKTESSKERRSLMEKAVPVPPGLSIQARVMKSVKHVQQQQELHNTVEDLDFRKRNIVGSKDTEAVFDEPFLQRKFKKPKLSAPKPTQLQPELDETRENEPFLHSQFKKPRLSAPKPTQQPELGQTRKNEPFLHSEFKKPRLSAPNPTQQQPELDKTEEDMTGHVIEEVVTSKAKETFRDEVFLQKINTWLRKTSINKKPRDADQHCSQVFKIWQFITEKESRKKLHDIVDTEQIEEWFSDQKSAPGTIRSYLSSLNLFMDFLITSTNQSGLIANCTSIKALNERLSKSLRKRNSERMVKIQTDALESMPTTAELKQFYESDEVKEAQAILARNNWGEVTPSVFCKARDYVISSLLLGNGQRSGAILGITREAIDKAVVTEDGATITVLQHKTGYAYPAHIGVSARLFKELMSYLALCEKVPGNIQHGDKTASIFISWPKPTESPGELKSTRGVQSLFEKTINKKNISATLLRKTTATTVRESFPEMRERLAAHMSHLASTADKYYVMKKNRDTALGMSKMITTCMTKQSGAMDTLNDRGTGCSSGTYIEKKTVRLILDIEDYQFSEFRVQKSDESSMLTTKDTASTGYSPNLKHSIDSPSPEKRSRFAISNDKEEASNSFSPPEVGIFPISSTLKGRKVSLLTLGESTAKDEMPSDIMINDPLVSDNSDPEKPSCLAISYDKEKASNSFSPPEVGIYPISSTPKGRKVSSYPSSSAVQNSYANVDFPEDMTSICSVPSIAACVTVGDTTSVNKEEETSLLNKTSFLSQPEERPYPIAAVSSGSSILERRNTAIPIDSSPLNKVDLPADIGSICSVPSVAEFVTLGESTTKDETLSDIVINDRLVSDNFDCFKVTEEGLKEVRVMCVVDDERRILQIVEIDNSQLDLYPTTQDTPDILPDDDDRSSVSEISHGRRSFLKNESELLIKLCNSMITENNNNTQTIIRTLENSEEGRELLSSLRARFGNLTNQKLKDRIKTEIKRKKQKLLMENVNC